MTNRGIVVLPKFTFDGKLLDFENGIDPVSLRFYLLYWDQLDYPNSNIMYTSSTPDEEYLIKLGIMKRTFINYSTFRGNLGYNLVETQLKAFQDNNTQDPGNWVLGQEGPFFHLPPDSAENTHIIEVELYRALPIPPNDIPLDDILSFKHKRASELMGLRAALDDLYLSIANSSDLPRAKTSAISRIETTLADLNKVTNERWAGRLFRHLKIEIDLLSPFMYAGTGVAIGKALGIPPENKFVMAMGAVGVVTSAIKFEMKPSLKPFRLPEHLRAFAYVHDLKKELR